MKTVKICGVPEHFNMPWHLCLENGDFDDLGIDLQWTDVPEGTGKMCELLQNNQTDIAIVLTEGILAHINQGNPSTIVQKYVESPLIWGVYVAYNSPYQTLSDLQNGKVAISRIGSGSHLMSKVQAHKNGWNTQTMEFEIVNTLSGAVDALTQGKADYFMWERTMTQPLVNQNIFRKIAEFPTPWPSFVIAVQNDFLQQNKALVHNILEIINTTTEEFKLIPSIDRTIANRYQLPLDDVKQWLTQTRWSQKPLTPTETTAIQNLIFKI